MLNKVPEVTLIFWIIKIMATTVGETVADLLAELRSRPGADRLPPAPLVAINERYASASSPVRAGDEVAIIPPVAGG